MIERLDTGAGNILGFRASGTLTEADYRDLLVPELDRAIEEYGKIRLLLKIEDFQGWTPGAAWEDFKLTAKIKHIDRMAVVGEENWDQWMTALVKFFAGFTDTEVRFFHENQMSSALDWLQEGAQREAASATAR
jgi:hypothetical protein